MIKLGDDQTVEYVEVVAEVNDTEIVKANTRRIKRPSDGKPVKKKYTRKLPHKDSLTNRLKRKYKIKSQSMKASVRSFE